MVSTSYCVFFVASRAPPASPSPFTGGSPWLARPWSALPSPADLPDLDRLMPRQGHLAGLGDVERLQRVLHRARALAAAGDQADKGLELAPVRVSEPLHKARIRAPGRERGAR